MASLLYYLVVFITARRPSSKTMQPTKTTSLGNPCRMITKRLLNMPKHSASLSSNNPCSHTKQVPFPNKLCCGRIWYGSFSKRWNNGHELSYWKFLNVGGLLTAVQTEITRRFVHFRHFQLEIASITRTQIGKGRSCHNRLSGSNFPFMNISTVNTFVVCSTYWIIE